MTEEQILNIWDRYYKVDPSRKNTKYGEWKHLQSFNNWSVCIKEKLMLRVRAW